MLTIADFASQLGVTPTLDRAISYSPVILSKSLAVPVEYSTRLKSSAGYTHFNRNNIGISLHPGLEREGNAALISTFLHEVAHVFEWLIYKSQPGFKMGHGYNWFEQMIRLGQVPQRTHNLANCKQRIDPISEIEL